MHEWIVAQHRRWGRAPLRPGRLFGYRSYRAFHCWEKEYQGGWTTAVQGGIFLSGSTERLPGTALLRRENQRRKEAVHFAVAELVGRLPRVRPRLILALDRQTSRHGLCAFCFGQQLELFSSRGYGTCSRGDGRERPGRYERCDVETNRVGGTWAKLTPVYGSPTGSRRYSRLATCATSGYFRARLLSRRGLPLRPRPASGASLESQRDSQRDSDSKPRVASLRATLGKENAAGRTLKGLRRRALNATPTLSGLRRLPAKYPGLLGDSQPWASFWNPFGIRKSRQSVELLSRS
jgi:hypothetical protein